MWGRKLCVSTMSQIAWWSYSAAWWSSFASFSGYWSMMRVEMCWINWVPVCRHVSTCRQAGLIVWGSVATSCYQLLPAETWSCRGDVTGAQRRSPSPLQPASEMGSPGITWSTLSWASCQAIAGRSFLWNAALQSLHLGPGGWWIIEIGKPWNTRIFN